MEAIAEEARADPQTLLNAPHTAPVRRLGRGARGQGAGAVLRAGAARGSGLSARSSRTAIVTGQLWAEFFSRSLIA